MSLLKNKICNIKKRLANLEGLSEENDQSIAGIQAQLNSLLTNTTNAQANNAAEHGELGADIAQLQADVAALGNSNSAISELLGRSIYIETVTDQSIANATVDNQNVNINGILSITEGVTEDDFAFINGIYEYVGTKAKRIEGWASVHQEIPNTANFQRPSPVLVIEVSYDNEATWEEWTIAATGYVRDASDHEESSNTPMGFINNPVTGTKFRLSAQIDSLTNAVISDTGFFTLKAYTDKDVVGLASNGSGTPNDGSLVTDSYQGSGNFTPFSIQVRNQAVVNSNSWQIVVRNAGYQNQSSGQPLFPIGINTSSGIQWEYSIVDNGDSTYDHFFTGIDPLPAGGNIQFSSGTPDADNAPGFIELFI